MKNKKRITSILIFIIVLISLTGCNEAAGQQAANNQPVVDSQNGGSNQNNNQQNNNQQNNNQQNNQNNNQQSNNQENNQGFINNEKVKIIIDNKSTNNAFKCAQYDITIEDKMNQNIIVQMDNVTVDGINYSPTVSVDVVSGSTKKDAVRFMEINNINQLKNVRGTILILNDSFETIETYNFSIN